MEKVRLAGVRSYADEDRDFNLTEALDDIKGYLKEMEYCTADGDRSGRVKSLAEKIRKKLKKCVPSLEYVAVSFYDVYIFVL